MRVMVLMLCLTGCDLLDEARIVRHCDLRDAIEPTNTCQEYGLFGPDEITMRGTCEALGGAWGREPCPRDGIVGGCENIEASNPWDVVEWYYGESLTPEQVAAECDEDEEIYVDPPG